MKLRRLFDWCQMLRTPMAALLPFALLALISCTTPSSTSPSSTTSGLKLYSAVELTASWQGGATPTSVKAFTPSSYPGSLCPATAVTLSIDRQDSGLVVGSSCTIPISYAVCFPVGAPQLTSANGGSFTCGSDPLQTPFNQLLFNGVGAGTSGEVAISLPPANGSLILFYCDSKSTLTGPPLSASLGCLGP